MRVVGLDQPQVNDGWLCDRGQFGYDYVNSPTRLRAPLIRKNGQLEPASWDEALAFVARAAERDQSAAGGGRDRRHRQRGDDQRRQLRLPGVRRQVGRHAATWTTGWARSGRATPPCGPGPGAIAALPKCGRGAALRLGPDGGSAGDGPGAEEGAADGAR